MESARHWFDMEIHILTSPHGLPIIANNPHISKIIVHNKSIIGSFASIVKVRAEHYDVWIDPKDHSSSEGTMLAKFSAAKILSTDNLSVSWPDSLAASKSAYILVS